MEVALIVTFLAAMLVIALVVYLFLRDAERRRQAEYRRSVMTEVLPNRLQAYERLSLYLDRPPKHGREGTDKRKHSQGALPCHAQQRAHGV